MFAGLRRLHYYSSVAQRVHWRLRHLLHGHYSVERVAELTQVILDPDPDPDPDPASEPAHVAYPNSDPDPNHHPNPHPALQLKQRSRDTGIYLLANKQRD